MFISIPYSTDIEPTGELSNTDADSDDEKNKLYSLMWVKAVIARYLLWPCYLFVRRNFRPCLIRYEMLF